MAPTRPASNYIIPTGNLGNAMACVWARHVGLPIEAIVLATNANRTVTEELPALRRLAARASVATLASAMDVGNPSNMERLRSLHPESEELQGQPGASSVDDIEIRGTLRRDAHELSRIWCPHTATAAKVYRRMLSRGARGHRVIVSTAHPAKFNDIVEPQTGQEVPVPPTLATLLPLPRQEQELEPSLPALRTQCATKAKTACSFPNRFRSGRFPAAIVAALVALIVWVTLLVRAIGIARPSTRPSPTSPTRC